MILKKLQSLLTKHDRRYLLLLLLLSLSVSVVETVGVSAILPFVTVASDFGVIEKNQYYRFVYELFGFSSPVGFITFFGIGLVVFYIFRSGFNLFYFYMLILQAYYKNLI